MEIEYILRGKKINLFLLYNNYWITLNLINNQEIIINKLNKWFIEKN